MIRRISLLCYLLLVTSFAYGYNLRQITNRDGLSNSAILSISQDKDGVMWFGSCDGLNIYNGVNIHLYSPSDAKQALSGNLIENIIRSNDGSLWIHTNYGLDRLDYFQKSLKSFDQFKGLYYVQQDHRDIIFIINSDGHIYYYNKVKEGFEKFRIDGVMYNEVLDFTITSSGILQIITNQKHHPAFNIIYNKDGTIHLEPTTVVEHNKKLLSCFHERDNSDTLFFIDENFILYEYDIKNTKKYYVRQLDNSIVQKGVISSIIKHKEEYYIGFKTDGLVRLYKNERKDKHYLVDEINIRAGIFCLVKDRYQDLIWIGTDGQGVYMYSNMQYTIKSHVFSNFHPQVEKPVRALCVDDQKSIWVGTKGDGLLRIKDNKEQPPYTGTDILHFKKENSGLNCNTVYVVEKSNRDICWIGTEEGLCFYSYKENQIKEIVLKNADEKVKYIHGICELDDNSLWIATVGMGVFRYEISGTKDHPELTNSRLVVSNTDEETHNYFFTIFQENDSTLWFGNRGYGVYRANTRSFEVESHPVPPSTGYKQTINDVFSIYIDKSKNLWMGTSDGLVKKNPEGEVQIFSTKTGFLNNTIHCILPDGKSNLWLSTNRGIVKFNTEDHLFQTFSEHNGLGVIEFSDGASFSDPGNETLLFGGINGFISIIETGNEVTQYQPEIKFDKFMLYGDEANIYDFMKDENTPYHIALAHNQNFFSLSFIALDFLDGHNYTCFYMLEPLSNSWIDNGTSNTIAFTGLKPDTYKLSVKFKNRLTGLESSIYVKTIKIHVPWYTSGWAIAIYALALLTIVFLLTREAIIRKRKKELRKEEEVLIKHKEEVYESKLRFFTNIAHEFCTPLALIYGPCARILSRHNIDPFIKNYTLIIQRNAERLNDLIQDLIEFRRIETDNMKPSIEQLDLNETVDDIMLSFRELLDSKKIHLEIDIPSNLSWNTDKNFFYTILSNLLSNAYKYTPEEGLIRLSFLFSNGILSVQVDNSGKGIKPKYIERIFDRYVILDNLEKQDGNNIVSRNGLGLAISYSMAKLLGGNITVASEPDKMTSFTVYLPEPEMTKHTAVSENDVRRDLNQEKRIPGIYTAVKEEVVVAVKEEEVMQDNDKNKPTVLVIDDDEEMLWLLNETLSFDYHVMRLNNPTQVEGLLEKKHPDVILSDVMMEGTDGVAVTRLVKKNKKTTHIPVLLISADHSIEGQIRGLDSGAEIYITKPFNPEVLKSTIRQILSRKEVLKDYYNSPLSSFEMIDGDMTHKEDIRFIQNIYDIIDRNITNKDLSADFIAEKLHLSPRHLYRKLSSISKLSLSEIIKESRLYTSRNLLLNTQLTIDEVLYRSGYTNRSTFFRVFSSKFGCTPKEYRDKHLKGNE